MRVLYHRRKRPAEVYLPIWTNHLQLLPSEKEYYKFLIDRKNDLAKKLSDAEFDHIKGPERN
jgi:hypothetical protein